MADAALARTPLYDLHVSLGAKLVPFAGYAMPLHYEPGILAEHRHTRAQAGLFDVSHMGQARVDGADAARALETLVPGDIMGLAPGRMRYTLLTNAEGGILDDFMVTRRGDHLHLVVNAACKEADFAHLAAGHLAVTPLPDRALLALQGPAAAAVLARLAPAIAGLAFLEAGDFTLADFACTVARSGYTGDDGFEISLPADGAAAVARRLLAEPETMAVGLGARDTLRLEAGFCLYGHDIDATTTPIEADLGWTIAPRRRQAGNFPGAAVVARQLRDGPARKRVGIRPADRAPAREGTAIVGADGAALGRITSGSFGPSVGAPVAMGYVAASHAAPGTSVGLVVRGTTRPAQIVKLPFVPHRYHRGGKTPT
jgi:glycine cleavage system T protein (aminomethyltransferase)